MNILQRESFLRHKMAAKKELGGYNCEFVEKPADYLQVECPVCIQILREPYLTSCCGYNFCRLCIHRVQADGKACPTCNEKEFTVSMNKGVQRMLNSFKVLCSNEEQGCKWTGELGSLNNHINANPPKEKQLEGCEFTEVECIHCNDVFHRNKITLHQSEHCPKRPFSCEYCKTYKTHYDDIVNNHWPVCDQKPVPCPNKCGENPLHGELKKHIDDDCSLTLVDCEFPGCEVKIYRKDMADHLQKELINHVSLLSRQFQQENQILKKHVATLQYENNTLKGEMKVLTNSVDTLRTKKKTLEDQVKTLTKRAIGVDKLLVADGENGIAFIMSRVSVHCAQNTSQSFEPFYTHLHGYKMKFEAGFARRYKKFYRCLVLEVRVYLMQGEFDSDLKWPVEGNFQVHLLNQKTKVYDKELIRRAFKANRPSQSTTSILLNDSFKHALGLSAPLPPEYVTQNDCAKFRIIFTLN